jgi:Fe-S-cluster-containing hydrogenase component 2
MRGKGDRGTGKMAVIVDKDACVGCESCVPVCPVEAISMNGDKAVIDQAKCTKCEACVGECPVEAIKVE